jgi:hypothetical protein
VIDSKSEAFRCIVRSKGVLEYEHEGAVILENIGNCPPVDTAQHPRRRWGVGGCGLTAPRRWDLQHMPKRRKSFIPAHCLIPKTRLKMLICRLLNGRLYLLLLIT